MDIEQIVKLICVKGGNISDAELAKKLNTTPQNFNNKKKRGTLKLEDIEKIANVLGFELEINIKKNDETFKVY